MDFFIIKMGAHSLRFSYHIEVMNESETEVLLERNLDFSYQIFRQENNFLAH